LSVYLIRGIAKHPTQNKQPTHASRITTPHGRLIVYASMNVCTVYPLCFENWRFSY